MPRTCTLASLMYGLRFLTSSVRLSPSLLAIWRAAARLLAHRLTRLPQTARPVSTGASWARYGCPEQLAGALASVSFSLRGAKVCLTAYARLRTSSLSLTQHGRMLFRGPSSCKGTICRPFD